MSLPFSLTACTLSTLFEVLPQEFCIARKRAPWLAQYLRNIYPSICIRLSTESVGAISGFTHGTWYAAQQCLAEDDPIGEGEPWEPSAK